MTDYWSEKNILITGGAGFIGSNLANDLFNLGCNVTVIDNLKFSDGSRLDSRINLLRADTRDINTLNIEGAIHVVFHFGEYARVEQSFADINTVLDFNYSSISEILKFCEQKRSKLIYSGSSTKFGDEGSNKFASPYALTKYLNTELVKKYCEWQRIDYAICYFYNVYGDAETSTGKYSTVIGKFLEMKKRGVDKLPVTSPGVQTRNFTHIDDTVDALKLIAESGYGDDYGIAADDAISILEIVSALGCTPDLVSNKPGNRMTAEVRTDKTKSLGWSAKRNIKQYLRENS